ncbi:MAG: DUF1211 domain-containing protein [Ignavibacteriae bacterium]|nr:DUF1211 domain-containing protein [Ignavibacteriota bacterium]
MGKGRLEAFSDGVIAIIITIMVLELKVPKDYDFNSIFSIIPHFLSYVLSFIYLGIYWNNHHHLLHVCKKVNGKILWANLHLLFWLSLVPFATAWMGENHFETIPSITYGVILFFSAIAYYILQIQIIKTHGENSDLKAVIGNDFKGKVSVVLYLTAILAGFIFKWISFGIYILVALIWLIPDKRIEKKFSDL